MSVSYHQSHSNRIDKGAAVVDTLSTAPAELGERFMGDDAAVEELRGDATDKALPPARDAFEAAFFSVSSPLGSWGVVPDTTAYPWRTIAYLDILTVDPDGTEAHWRGTAFLVSPRTFITAGHNVYLHDHGGWARSIEVHPGRNASGSPFGSIVAHEFFSTDGWVNGRSSDFDYGAIILDQDLGSKLGYFGLLSPSDPDLAANELSLAGYPNTSGEQVGGGGRSQAETNGMRVYYDIPTAIGQSGAPVWFNGIPRAIAVHAYDSGSFNSAVRMNDDVLPRISGWLK